MKKIRNVLVVGASSGIAAIVTMTGDGTLGAGGTFILATSGVVN